GAGRPRPQGDAAGRGAAAAAAAAAATAPAVSRGDRPADRPARQFDDLGPYEGPEDTVLDTAMAASLAARTEPLSPSTNRPRRSPSSARRRAAVAAAGPAGSRSARRKPKDPPKWALALGVLAVLLSGVAAAYLLQRLGDDDTESAEPPASTSLATGDGGAGTGTENTGASTSAPAATTLVDPSVRFDEAALGPIVTGTEYQIGIEDGPADATYQLFIDDQPVADPATTLPPVTFDNGLHKLQVEISDPSGPVTSPVPVLVYAAGPAPTAPEWRANLSSVNVVEEGWTEAVTQYQDFAAGHADLQMMPSDWIPSLPAGYWNIFVGGFSSRDQALAYCNQSGLAVPDQCFAVRVEPGAAADG
ncbi:MAG: hypothetical protein ACK5RL_18260, partial [Acidimicrobiales bacterium]